MVDPATGLDSTTRTSTHETLKYYDKNGNVINEVLKVTENDTLNNTTRSSYSVNTYEYDRMGRLIRKTDPAGNAVEKINYNYNSAQIESYDGEDHLKTFEYNKDGKVSVTKQRLEAGEYRKTEQFYDANGNVSTVIDGKGNQTVYTYNEQNKLTEVSSYEKVGEGLYNSTDTTRYTYYNNGNMKSQEINGIITNTLHYNARNLVKEKEYLGTSNNIVSYNYYADGTVSDVTDRENIKTQYLYNPQGLVLEENAVDGKDQSFTKKSFEYDNAGNQLKSTITSSTTAPEVIERTYDELGRVKTKAVSNIEGKVIYVYDIVTSEGLTAETAIDQKNNTTTKVYDTTGRLAFVKKGDIEAENAAQYIYYGNGAAQSVIYAGGAREDYEYYEDGLLKSLINTKNDGSELESFVYTYDENGNMLSKLDNKGITEYTYDNLNRLKTVDEHYSGKNTEYAYDKLGNRTTEIIKESGIIKEHIYSYNYDLNQLDKVTVKIGGTVNSTTDYGYDANGNQISSVTDGKTITYAYDEFNQLISTNGAGYGYNAEGYRISKKVDGSLTKYLYEFDKVVLEVESKTGQADKVNRNIYGTNLLMRTADGQSYYYMYNGHADVTALINVATGNVDATYYYDAFGNIDPTGTTGDVNNNITYAGYQYDEETGLYYLNARMYDPKVARFLQEDTYSGSVNDPLSLNLYAYCANNPLIYYDPTGHSWERQYNGSTLEWVWEDDVRYDGSELRTFKKTANDQIVGDLLNNLENGRRGEYSRTYNKELKTDYRATVAGHYPLDDMNFDITAGNESLNIKYMRNASKVVKNSGIGDLSFDFNLPENATIDEYINIMGPFWELNQKYRTIDDNIRDASICTAIITAFAAPSVAPQIASAAYTTKGSFLLANAEPIVYGTSGVVFGGAGLVNDVKNKDYGNIPLDLVAILGGGLALNNSWNSYNCWTGNNLSNISNNNVTSSTRVGGGNKQTILKNIAESKAARESSNFRNPKQINPGERTIEAYYNSSLAKGNPNAIEVFNSEKFQNLSKVSGIDCSELAEYMYKNAGGKGEILNYSSSINKFTEINTPAKGGVYKKYFYHTVYSDGAYIYDPWYTTNPVPKDVYSNLVNIINNGSVIVGTK